MGHEGKSHNLGSYLTEEEAAKAYDRFVREHRPPGYVTNFNLDGTRNVSSSKSSNNSSSSSSSSSSSGQMYVARNNQMMTSLLTSCYTVPCQGDQATIQPFIC